MITFHIFRILFVVIAGFLIGNMIRNGLNWWGVSIMAICLVIAAISATIEYIKN